MLDFLSATLVYKAGANEVSKPGVCMFGKWSGKGVLAYVPIREWGTVMLILLTC